VKIIENPLNINTNEIVISQRKEIEKIRNN